MTDQHKGPVYTGMRKFVDVEEGYGIWLPSDWKQTDMVDGHRGVIFSPYPDRLDTCFASEKHRLQYKVTQEDLADLRTGFEAGLNALPGVEIHKKDEIITDTLLTLEAVFSYEEDGQRRKRWVRNVYWEEGQLVLIAQGATPEEYEYWLPMFFNTMMTAEIGLPQ